MGPWKRRLCNLARSKPGAISLSRLGRGVCLAGSACLLGPPGQGRNSGFGATQGGLFPANRVVREEPPSGESTRPVRDHTTIRLVIPHNLCYMNSGVLAALHAIRQEGQTHQIRALRRLVSTSVSGSLSLERHMVMRALLAGWTVDQRQRDAAEFTHHMLYQAGFRFATWESRIGVREAHQTVDAGQGLVLIFGSPQWGMRLTGAGECVAAAGSNTCSD